MMKIVELFLIIMSMMTSSSSSSSSSSPSPSSKKTKHSFLSRNPFDRETDSILLRLAYASDPSKVIDEFTKRSEPSLCYTHFIGHEDGLGSAIHQIANRILFSLLRNAPMISNATSLYSAHCESRSYSCLFEPFYDSMPRHELGNCVYNLSEWCFFEDAMIDNFRSSLLMETYMSIVVRYVTRPSPVLKSWIKSWSDRFELSSSLTKTLSVHVRRSDKETIFHHTNEDFLRKIVALKQKYGYDRVLLGSDSDVRTLIKTLIEKHEMKVIQIPNELFHSDPTFYQHKENQGSYHTTGLALMTQIHLMSRTQGFLGTMSSNTGRIVYELQNNKNSFYEMDGLDYFPCPMFYDPPYGVSWSTRAKCDSGFVWESRLRLCV